MNRHQRGRTSKKSKRKANKRLHAIEEQVSNYKGICLFVTDDNGGCCGKPVSNNCHIVSKSAVLDELRDKETKNVLELQWGVSKWRELVFKSDVEQRVQDTATFDPSPKSTDDACMGRFACNTPHSPPHDTEFQRIDVAQPDLRDPTVRFLSGYRLALFMADQFRLARKLQGRWDRAVLRNSPPNARNLWSKEKEKLRTALWKAESTAKSLGKNWHERKTGGTFDPDLISARVLRFRSKLRLAGGVSYGKATVVTVFPTQGDWHKMGVLYLTSDSDLVGEDLERLAGVARASEQSDNYSVTVIDELMTNEWGTLAVSPASYEGLNDQDCSTIQSLVARHSRPWDPRNPSTD